MNSYVVSLETVADLPRRAQGAVQTAIIGLGRMGMLHANLIAHHVPDINVVALADPRSDVLTDAARLFPDAARYQAGLEALEHPDLQACLVATSTSGHREIVEAALAGRLHVFCEKPITLDPQEVLLLANAASLAGVTLQTGFWRRFSPAWSTTRQAVRNGSIGAPLMARSSQWDASAPPLAFCDRDVSGGLFVDCGVHDFDIIEWVTGHDVTAVTAVPLALAKAELASVGDADNGLLILELGKGVAGIIDISRNGGYVDEVRMEILGTEGSILVSTEPHGRAILRTKSGVKELTRSTDMPAFELGVIGELEAFSARSSGSEVAVPGGRDDARALTLAQAAWASHDGGGRRVEVPRRSPSLKATASRPGD